MRAIHVIIMDVIILGVKMTLIKFGENKAEGISTEPLTDSARAHLQEMVDTFGAMVDKAVARGRGAKQEDVHKRFGQGRVFDAKQAVRLGMADRIADARRSSPRVRRLAPRQQLGRGAGDTASGRGFRRSGRHSRRWRVRLRLRRVQGRRPLGLQS